MKKLVAMMVAVVLVLSLGTGLKAEDKELNLLANLGFAFSDVEGLFLDLGVEKQFKQNLFALLYLDYYFNPTGLNESGSLYGVGYDVSLTLMGINLAAAYKRELNEKIKWFVRAGVLLALSRLKVTGSYMGVSLSDSTSATDFGLSAGGGIEYILQKKLALVAGVAISMIFSDGTGTWFKIFAGINYKLK